MTRVVPRPWLTYGLIAANLAAFAWSLAMGVSVSGGGQGRLLVDLGANFGTLTLRGEPWRMVTATFLHAGLLHLTMNMFGLHDGGRQIEAIYGRSGMGAFPVSRWSHEELLKDPGLRLLGDSPDLVEHFFLISAERRIQHPLVQRLLPAP